MNVVYILWLRQLKRYIRSKPRIIGALGQPLLFLLALGFGFGSIFQRAGQGKDRKSTRLNSSHIQKSRMPSSA